MDGPEPGLSFVMRLVAFVRAARHQQRGIYLYRVLLPFGLVDSIGMMTPVIVVFIAYTFLALETLGAEIEEPFGLQPNDLALDAMSANIEVSLRQMLGDRDLSGAPVPVDCVLT